MSIVYRTIVILVIVLIAMVVVAMANNEYGADPFGTNDAEFPRPLLYTQQNNTIWLYEDLDLGVVSRYQYLKVWVPAYYAFGVLRPCLCMLKLMEIALLSQTSGNFADVLWLLKGRQSMRMLSQLSNQSIRVFGLVSHSLRYDSPRPGKGGGSFFSVISYEFILFYAMVSYACILIYAG